MFLLILLSVALGGSEPEHPGAVAILPAGAELETLWGEGEFTEGGALADDGAILFSDIGDRTMRYDPATGDVTVFRAPSGRTNGLIFDPKGRLIAAEGANTGGGRRVVAIDSDGTVTPLADKFEGKRFNSPNDVAVDATGRVYFTDPRYVGDEPRELDDEAVYRIDPDGSVQRLRTTATRPNGIAVSPDGRALYVSDNGPERKALLRLDLDPITGAVSKPKVLKTFGNGRGIDGLTVTEGGRIVTAAGAGRLAGVYVYEPDGTPLAFLDVPEAPTNVEFGGPDRQTLYITAGKGLYRIKTTLTGHHLWPPKE